MTFKQRFAVCCGVIAIGLLLLGGWQSPVQAGVLPPPRATLTPTPHAYSSAGTYIELRLPTDNLNLWTAVQWQDSLGNWHDVEGWRGSPDATTEHKSNKIWWVLPYSYGKGPVRWQVYDRVGGQLLATSQSFFLPQANQHVVVELNAK
jgi:hypothetical protein